MVEPLPIHVLETIEELEAWCAKQEMDALRALLFREFDAYAKYETVADWNRLVRACECLNIVGWGEREVLEPGVFRGGGFPHTTTIRNAKGDEVLRSARWWKRKAGIYLGNRHDYPPNSKGLGIDTLFKRLENHELRFDGDKLRDPRNCNPAVPIHLLLYGNADRISDLTDHHIDRFGHFLKLHVEPAPHWDYLQNVRIFYHVGKFKMYRGKLKVGPFRRKAKAVFTDFSVKYILLDLDDEAQKRYLAEPLRQTVMSLGPKLDRTKTPHTIGVLLADIDRAIDAWVSEPTELPDLSEVDLALRSVASAVDAVQSSH